MSMHATKMLCKYSRSFIAFYVVNFIDPQWFLPKVWIPAGFTVRVPVVMVLGPKLITDHPVSDLLCIDGHVFTPKGAKT